MYLLTIINKIAFISRSNLYFCQTHIWTSLLFIYISGVTHMKNDILFCSILKFRKFYFKLSTQMLGSDTYKNMYIYRYTTLKFAIDYEKKLCFSLNFAWDGNFCNKHCLYNVINNDNIGPVINLRKLCTPLVCSNFPYE
jgi:hypothetical protein